jgi:OOP family OmpA-OmpF porin
MMKIKILLSTSLIAALSATVAFAGGAPKGGLYDGYVHSSAGQLARDADGHCIRAGTWKPSLAIPECEGHKHAPAPKRVVKIEKPRPIKRRIDPKLVNVTLQAGALFDVNKSNIKSRGKEKLDILARKLKETITTENIEIAGHTDSTGSDAYNQRLSQRRAQSVKDYLVTQGVPSEKIQTIGFGESKPVASNTTKQGRARNRRVEVRIRATKQIQ